MPIEGSLLSQLLIGDARPSSGIEGQLLRVKNMVPTKVCRSKVVLSQLLIRDARPSSGIEGQLLNVKNRVATNSK